MPIHKVIADTPMKTNRETSVVTVAAIRRSKRARTTQYLFNEKQRIFALRPETRYFAESARMLKQASGTGRPIKAILDIRRPVIERVELPSPREIEEFQRHRIPLENPERTLPIDVKSIDPTVFNVVGHYLKPPIFRLCTRIIPSYKKAKQIFDFCAQQSCHLPGPYAITPCIPFQYVVDGCYARAHKMRWIITEKYGYCCEKVFSFALGTQDTLAVKADKWGGCCVKWWYHVAPLVRVKISLGRLSVVLALVIDPGMFDKPVLLSTWLSAQENKTCDPGAKVTMYSIQPGSAYWPTNGLGTAFGTDPTYSLTDDTLNDYHALTTCP